MKYGRRIEDHGKVSMMARLWNNKVKASQTVHKTHMNACGMWNVQYIEKSIAQRTMTTIVAIIAVVGPYTY
jgi:hypothetical protein